MKKMLTKKFTFSFTVTVQSLSIIALLIMLAAALIIMISVSAYRQRQEHTDKSNSSGINNQYIAGSFMYPMIYNSIPYPDNSSGSDQTDDVSEMPPETGTDQGSDNSIEEKKRLVDVGRADYGMTPTTDMSQFPGYDFGVMLSGFNKVYRRRSKMSLSKEFSTLGFDVTIIHHENDANLSPLNLRLFDSDTGIMLWEGTCDEKDFLTGITVDITGVKTLEWAFIGGSITSSSVGYILNPFVW